MITPANDRSLAVGSLSLTTLAAVLLYALGAFYFLGFYSAFGVDAGFVNIPLYNLMMPKMPVLIMLYHLVLTIVSLAGIHLIRAPGEVIEPADQPRWADKLERVVGVLSVIGFWVNAIFWWNSNTASIVSGTALGLLLWTALKMVVPQMRFMLAVIVVYGLCTLSQYYGSRDAGVFQSPEVEYWTSRSGEKPEHGRILTYDGRNYFFLETRGKRVTIVNASDVSAVRFQ